MSDTSSNGQAAPPDHVPPERVVDLDIYAPHGEGEDYFAAWLRWRESSPFPVLWTPHHGGHWIAMRGAGVLEVLSDSERFSVDSFGVPRAPAGQRPLGALLKDPPEHAPWRRFLNLGLSPRVVSGSEAAIRARAIELIENVRPRGACEAVTDFADVLPLSVFLDLVDLPLADREMLANWTAETVRGADVAAREAAFNALAAYLAPVLHERRGGTGDDMLSAIARLEVDGAPVTDEEAVGAAIHLCMAGLDTVASLLVFVLEHLARHPAERSRMRREPAYLEAAATEFTRRFPIVVMSRRVRADIEFGGVQLHEDDMISAPTMLHNLDPDLFPAPLAFDPARKASHIATFGHGIHRCPGAALGRRELLVTLQEWLPRIPDFALADPAGQRVDGGIVASMPRLDLRWSA
ncbi:MAG: cytochrome P450 [Planctomycetes bacterium]|nr:cytochrome P450 [Planctomycetota bacterium]